MSKTRQIDYVKPYKGQWIGFLQNDEFMGFVEKAGAKEIITSARRKGFRVRHQGSYFNVEVRGSEEAMKLHRLGSSHSERLKA